MDELFPTKWGEIAATLAGIVILVSGLVAFFSVGMGVRAQALAQPENVFNRVPPLPLDVYGSGVALALFSANVLLLGPDALLISAALAAIAGLIIAEVQPAKVMGLGLANSSIVLFVPVLYYFASYLPTLLAEQLSQEICRALEIENEPQDAVQLFMSLESVASQIQFVFMAVVLHPVIEEFLFRGVLYGWLKGRLPRLAGILISAVVFGYAHHHLPTLLPLTVLGIGLALSYEATGSLWTPIAMHATFNGVSLLSILAWGAEPG